VLAPSLYETMLRSRFPGEVFRPGQREECRVRCAYLDGTHSVPYLLPYRMLEVTGLCTSRCPPLWVGGEEETPSASW